MLKTEMIFGRPCARLYSVEFQNCGLPHAHILVPEHKIMPDKIDNIVCAENHTQHLTLKCTKLWCQTWCMDHVVALILPAGNTLSHLYLRQKGADSYPLYRRRSPEDGGQVMVVIINVRGSQTTQEVDNRWAVPYKKYLLTALNRHCNVELFMLMFHQGMY